MDNISIYMNYDTHILFRIPRCMINSRLYMSTNFCPALATSRYRNFGEPKAAILSSNLRIAANLLPIAASYSSSQTNSSSAFLSYFASTTPDSDSKRIRLKTIFFLQASELYNVEPIRTRLQEHEKLLNLELAIVEGKVRTLKLSHRDFTD